MRLSKFLKTFFLFLVFISQSSYGQGVTNKLNQADSLFQEKKYTESLDIYEDIVTANKKASPAMLLRMAYIYEG